MDVGFVGLGRMGQPMARHLLEHRGDSRLTVLERTSGRLAELAEAGATVVATSREVAEASELVVVMVPAIADIRAALEGPDGLLAGVRRPLLLVVSSTTAPQDVRDLQADLAGHEPPVTVVDAPVSGGVEGAKAATLSIMVGGPDAAAAAVVEILAPAGRAVHLGPLGAGQVAKACNQLIVAAQIVAVAEASLLAERAGLDVGKLLDLLGGGYAASRVLEVKGPKLVAHDHSPDGPAKFMIKDLSAARDEAAASGLRLVTGPVLLDAFTSLTEAGLGDQDTTVVQEWIAQQSPATTTPGR